MTNKKSNFVIEVWGNVILQSGGDFISGNGYGAKTIYDNLSTFNDEGFQIDHIGPLWVNMANSGEWQV